MDASNDELVELVKKLLLSPEATVSAYVGPAKLSITIESPNTHTDEQKLQMLHKITDAIAQQM